MMNACCNQFFSCMDPNAFAYQKAAAEVISESLQYMTAQIKNREETTTMQVTYNGFTGELVKLEKKETGRYMVTPYDTAKHPVFGYDISIYDREKKATISFTGVKLGDVKFGGGAVTFDG